MGALCTDSIRRGYLAGLILPNVRRISSDGITNTVTKDHTRTGGQWVLLGTYGFAGSGGEYVVEVADVNAGRAIADAIRFVKLGGSATVSKLYMVHTDHLGTAQRLTDETATLLWAATHTPLGSTNVDEDPDGDGNPITLNLRFPGQHYDSESGLLYGGARYWDPSLGRSITADPRSVGEHVQRRLATRNLFIPNQPPLEINPYAYVANNPTRWIDPTGEAAQAVAGCAAGAWAGPVGCGAGAAIATGLTILGGAAILSGDTPQQCDDKKKKCKLHSQNRIGLPAGKIRCNYICPLGSGGSGFVTRIIDGDSCPAEADWVPGDQGF